MADTIASIERRMMLAADALDFEEARRLRDQLNLLRGGADPEGAAQADTAGLTRQQPGAMGLGSSRSRPMPPPGWKPPARPDSMTSGRSKRKRPN
ncbi:UvrB/UvrC motif-containing protein [Sphingomonas sp. 37zxx]|uniref:UvrB/UvrC motif-containing protein n=1 Tax=Sphingomonas sp. 37zxx TaxID=1550073 RepID=UPI00053BF1A4|nr:UvrB/UvrC motif-containing protein [Sphingomonas sp. 37zxx]